MWPVFAAQDGGFALFPFAKAGATCSNNLTARPFPSLAHLGAPHERAARPCRGAGSTALVLWSGTSSVQVDYYGMHGARARCEWRWGC